jgi:murein DD-endopeptidase MepM/ murein hydrolase activator NlpD
MRTTTRHRIARIPARLALATALVLPASAIAAPPVSDSASPASPPKTDGSAAAGIALVTGLGAGLAADPPNGPYVPVAAPVDYGTAINRFGGGGMRTHAGQDMFAPEGTAEISPVATTVIETGADGSRGNWAALYDAAEDRTFVYMHMLEPAEVKAGQKLAAGERVGLLGCTGSCEGAHLHFEIRDGRDPYGTPHDPLPELRRWQPAPRG